MRFIRTAALAAFALTSALPVLAGDIKLSGTAALDEEGCAKGTSGPDCTINFTVTGKAAKVIYDGMQSKGAMQECTGSVEKFEDSGLHCVKGKAEKDYFCDFSYAFKQKSFGAGPDGC
ncbi:MAG: hypothetical protein U1E15_07795 [Hyphomicrobiales bacterium]